MKLTAAGGIRIDANGAFAGSPYNNTPWLSFGLGSGEGVGSNRMSSVPGSINLDGLDFYTGYTIRFSVSRAGNVLIGKTSQTNTSYKLDVVGTARADRLVVNTTGADFVFPPIYQLPLSLK